MDKGEKEKVVARFAAVPAFFIENQGQSAKEVKYYFKGNDNVYFTDNGVVFQKIVGANGRSPLPSHTPSTLQDTNPPHPPLTKGGNGGIDSPRALVYRLDFLGAKPTSPQARSELKGKVNYLIGNDRSKWHTNIPTYQEIVYPQQYEGIDMVYKGVPGGMKYEFIVQPGANPDGIRLAYTVIEGLSIDDSGNLIIHTSLGDVKDAKPYCYQEIDGKCVEVGCNFSIQEAMSDEQRAMSDIFHLSLRGSGATEAISYSSKDEIASPSARNDKDGTIPQSAIETIPNSALHIPQWEYGFEVSSYNKDYPLIIDPGLEYSTFLGGSDVDWGFGIAVDGSGYAYVTGGTYDAATDFPTTTGAYDETHNGSGDVFVTRLNTTGTALEYSTFLGGSGWDEGWGIAVDGSGYAYVTGITVDAVTDFPTTTGAYDETHNGSGDAFVTRLNTTGTALEYSTFLGGSDVDWGFGIAVDGSGNAYVTGHTEDAVTDFPTTPGAYDETHNGIRDVFVTRLNTVVCQCNPGSRKGCISGTVTDGAGTPIAGKKVRANKECHKKLIIAVTDANGCYIFDGLGNGVYDVYVCGRHQIVEIAGRKKVNNVNFECRKN